MRPERTCPDCGATLPADAPRGLCPNCLMGAALPSTSPPAHEATGTFEPAGPGVLETIAHSIGPVPRVLLRNTAPGETPGPIVRPDATDADPTIRYRIDGEIARGGMGAILKGRDPDLGRDVAIKVLRADLSDKADLVRRFVEEAQIGGQLQHPGVVPIYELGTFADRRPFFSMKLVKGQTLADLLAARSGPADDLPRFLSIFAAIAQTMAYSHTRGVIHRDLKPSNVMVGSFGEVQVMDWGLARVLPRGGVIADARAGQEPPEETLITTAGSGSDRDLSRAGSIMGTPSYMPPEQARGQTDRIDERADVFALGSILCEVLTAKPAFTGRAATEILRKAADGATADAVARLDGCGSEAELIGLAKDCLAVEPEGRPRDANVVAERITAYLSGVQERVQAAERERAVAVARAIEERRRRKLQLGLAASLLALTTLGGLALTYELQRRQAAAARVDRLLAEARLLRDQARDQREDVARWDRAREAVGRIGEELGPAAAVALAELRGEVEAGRKAAEADRALLDLLVDIRSARADDPDGSATDTAYADVLGAAGIDPDRGDPAGAGTGVTRRPRSVAAALVAALDDWSAVRRSRDPKGAGWGGSWPPPAPPTPTRTATPSAPPCSSRTGPSGSGGSGRWPSGPRPGRGPRPAWSCSARPWPTRATWTRARRCCGGPPGPTRRTPRSTTRWATCWGGRGRRSRRRRSAPTRSPGPGSRSWPGTSWPTHWRGAAGGRRPVRSGSTWSAAGPMTAATWAAMAATSRSGAAAPRPRRCSRGRLRRPRGDPPQARRRRGPHQPRQRPARLGRRARRDRGVPRGDPPQARPRRGPPQPRRDPL